MKLLSIFYFFLKKGRQIWLQEGERMGLKREKDTFTELFERVIV